MGQHHGKILIVDDDSAIRHLFNSLLGKSNTVRQAANGEEGIEIAKTWSPDLVLLDIMMPGVDGYEICQQLKAFAKGPPPQVIMVSAKSTTTEQARAFELGADDYLVKPVDPIELRSRVNLHFRLRQSQAATEKLQRQVDSNHAALKVATRERLEQTVAVQDVAVFTLAKVAESRDNETGRHIVRMREYSQILARQLRSDGHHANIIDEAFLADLFRSSPLHDIGKVGIPDAILLKQGRLTRQEFEVMKRHTAIGGNILTEAATSLKGGGFLRMAAAIAQFHHEWWNGKGYLAGLAGEEIPLPARIVSVADVYDALTSERPYKEPWTPTHAKATIDNAAGTQFDPTIVDSFDHCFEEFVCIQQKHTDRNPVVVGAMSFLEYDLLENEIDDSSEWT